MKLILKKNDSATSLLLFIYNQYLTLNEKDSIRLTNLLQYMNAFGKNETAVRMSLSRATKAGLLVSNRNSSEVYYSITEDGKQAITLWNEGVMQFWKRYQLRNSKWNGNWHFINIQSSAGNKEARTIFLDKFQQLGFALVNTNTWASPYHQSKEIKALIDQFDMKSDVIEMYGEMRVHKELNQFIEDAFDLDKLHNLYRNFIDTFKQQLIKAQENHKEAWFIESGSSLPLLNELGWSFFKIASGDAVLPRDLVPQWAQDEAVSLFREYREILLPNVHYFLNKFN